MSEENVEILRRGYEAYERGELDAVVADFAPDCEYVAAGIIPGRIGIYRGPEGYKDFIAWLDEEFIDSHLQIEALIDAGDSVVAGVTISGQGRRGGITGPSPSGRCGDCRTARSFTVKGLSIRPRPSKPPGCGSRQMHLSEPQARSVR